MLYFPARPPDNFSNRLPGGLRRSSSVSGASRIKSFRSATRCVTNAGTFRLKHKPLFIANALKQYHIGLEETDDGIWSIYFGTVLLAKVDEREMIIRD
jgi:hypothetical protein